MAEQDSATKEPGAGAVPPIPTLEEMQHWTWIMGRAQQLMMEHLAGSMTGGGSGGGFQFPTAALSPLPWAIPDPAKVAQAQVDMWTEGLAIWQRALGQRSEPTEEEARADKDKRFNAPQWRESPVFDLIRQSYLLISDRLLGGVDALDGLDDRLRERLRFATRASSMRWRPAISR
jgi:polyhydroxyalkanoate synthase